MAGPGDDLIDRLRLIRSDGVGPRTFRALLSKHGGAAAAVEALPFAARRAGRGDVRVASRASVEDEIAAGIPLGVTFLADHEAAYPVTLRAIDTAPPVIAVRGDPAILARPAVAIVGSRNASAPGRTFAERLARDLGREGVAIVSGLARGIDARAHRGSIASGTVAVLAGGHDRIYPSDHERLLDDILAAGGAAVSEMPLGWEPRSRDFPRRNRIVSGLAYGTVVVEAARRSGSLITARFALEQGREVFGVPGSPLDPRSEGANDLIRSGATLCGEAEHVLVAIRPLVGMDPALRPGRPGAALAEAESGSLWDELDDPEAWDHAGAPASEEEPTDERDRLVETLGLTATSIDDLARLAELPVRTVQRIVVDLELDGTLERRPGGKVARRPR